MKLTKKILNNSQKKISPDYFIRKICYQKGYDIAYVKIDLKRIDPSMLIFILIIKDEKGCLFFAHFLYKTENMIYFQVKGNKTIAMSIDVFRSRWIEHAYVISPFKNSIIGVRDLLKHSMTNKCFLTYYLQSRVLIKDKPIHIRCDLHPYGKRSRNIFLEYYMLYNSFRNSIRLIINFTGSAYDPIYVEFILYHSQIQNYDTYEYLKKISLWFEKSKRDCNSLKNLFGIVNIDYRKMKIGSYVETISINEYNNFIEFNPSLIRKSISDFLFKK